MCNLKDFESDILLQYSKFLIAYSGGLDSTVLLYHLVKMRACNDQIEIRAIHVHHNLNTNADQWAEHCIKQCQQFHVPIIIEKIKINTHNLQEGIEADFRKKRYKIIIKNLQKKEVIITAHHKNDQCETILLALKRGSGPLGISGMAKETNIYNQKLIRPFLKITKMQLEIFAKKKIKLDRRYK